MKSLTGRRPGMLLLVFILLSATTKAQLTANFSASPSSGCLPLVVQFKDSSIGEPTYWKWDLGNGTTSYLQNPSATYFNAGNYTVSLLVKNSSGEDSIAKTQYIQVSAKPTVEFTASNLIGCYPLPVQFTSQSVANTGSIASWEWDFGDGTFASSANPTHVYTDSGNYNVSLRITNDKGCATTLSKPQYVQIGSGVKAGFSNTTSNKCSAPVTITFKNESKGTGALNYQWSFGDGSTSTDANPAHTYTTSGSFTVKLISTNANGCADTLVKVNSITVGNVVPSFTVADNSCQGASTVFTNTSSPLPQSVVWNFGDGTTATAINPVKVFAKAGTYRVKMTANFGGCTDSTFKTITIIPKPTAAFKANDTVTCIRPFTAVFTNTSVNAVSYQWNFGDNTTSTLANPSHVYTAYGNYTVQLVVTGANGCTDTLKKVAYIKITQTKITLVKVPDSGCAPFTKSFSANIAAVSPVATYLWSFGDGTTSTDATPTHTYNNAGTYPIRLIVTTTTGCTDTISVTRGIMVNTKPVASFTATPRDACARVPIVFTDQSQGNPVKWLWIFGDGSTSSQQNPGHLYNDTGYFDVQLIIWNSGCSDTVKYDQYIHITPPIARFGIASNCATPFERIFTDRSLGADTYTWDFGDGTTSTEQNPTHIFTSQGNFNVSLTVYNQRTGCDHTSIQAVQIVDVNPSFAASDSSICRGGTLTFKETSGTTSIKKYKWDFGDGTIVDTVTNPVKKLYKASGTYTVTLTTTDLNGCMDTVVKPAYVRIDGPVAKFAPAVAGSCLSSNVVFMDQSVADSLHPIQSWKWNYADGITETLTAPPFQHLYTKTGSYNVVLKVTDTRGCTDSFRLPTALIISKPIAKFTVSDTATCPEKAISFTNFSSGTNAQFLWYFGDGTTSTIKYPQHKYTADGVYTVKLVVTDQYGCTDSASKPNITIRTPLSSFTMSDSFSTCPPLIVQFTNKSQNVVSQTWDFGDGSTASIATPSHFYNYPGIYTVRLTTKGIGGCTSVMEKQIKIDGPTGTFAYTPVTGCNPLTTKFTATTKKRLSFVWDFNDGVVKTTTDSIILHTYTRPGIYIPKMILVDPSGCQVPITGKDTIVVSDVFAKMSFSDKAICNSGNISFTDSSSTANDVIKNYQWSFGDGKTDSAKNPVHNYTAPGLYYPKLIITSAKGCKDTIVSPKPVKIVASPKVDFTKTANGCTPVTISFDGIMSAPDTSAIKWQWQFGNGSESLLKTPPAQPYRTAGDYTIRLVATNSTGCTDTVRKQVSAYPIPVVNAGADTIICKDKGIHITASGASSYSWAPSTGLSCSTCATPLVNPGNPTTYTVTGTSEHGCTAVDSVAIKVQYPFSMTISEEDTLCKGQRTKLFAQGAATYEWTPSTGLDNSLIASPWASPATTTNYRVVGKDDRGCFTDTGYVPVKVYPIPTVEAGPDQRINVGKTLDLVPEISADVTSVIWSPTGAIFRNDYPAITVKPSTNTEYTVEVSNEGGCKAADKLMVYVLCNDANIFIPNTFSPNGDGANDVFYPRGTGLFRIKNLRIFNRWGELIFERSSFNANDPAAGWDGTYKGTKLPADVFVYMIDVICDNNTVMPYKGNVALLK